MPPITELKSAVCSSSCLCQVIAVHFTTEFPCKLHRQITAVNKNLSFRQISIPHQADNDKFAFHDRCMIFSGVQTGACEYIGVCMVYMCVCVWVGGCVCAHRKVCLPMISNIIAFDQELRIEVSSQFMWYVFLNLCLILFQYFRVIGAIYFQPEIHRFSVLINPCDNQGYNARILCYYSADMLIMKISLVQVCKGKWLNGNLERFLTSRYICFSN